MNEASNFCDSVCNYECTCTGSHDYQLSTLPYIPGRGKLDSMSIPLDATHYGGIKEFDAHNLFGIT